MTSDLKKYLLRYPSQSAAFRNKWGKALESNRESFLGWLWRLPLYEWTPLVLYPGQEEVCIGIICILYIDGLVNLSFNESMTMIRREALSEEEYLEYLKTAGFHGKALDKNNFYWE